MLLCVCVCVCVCVRFVDRGVDIDVCHVFFYEDGGVHVDRCVTVCVCVCVL